MTRVIWISGASSGIGAALARSVPYEDARLIGISRRPPVAGEHLPADLSEPAAWKQVSESFARELAAADVEQALLLHFSGQGSPHGRASDADPEAYERAVLLNAAAGPVLGQRFIAQCRAREVPAVLVVCSSPARCAATGEWRTTAPRRASCCTGPRSCARRSRRPRCSR